MRIPPEGRWRPSTTSRLRDHWGGAGSAANPAVGRLDIPGELGKASPALGTPDAMRVLLVNPRTSADITATVEAAARRGGAGHGHRGALRRVRAAPHHEWVRVAVHAATADLVHEIPRTPGVVRGFRASGTGAGER
jgi:hypothetical protein